eukprot:6194516-Pleurochrysis_carterae.AAC.2
METGRSPHPATTSSPTLTFAPLFSRISLIDEPPGPMSFPASVVETLCTCTGGPSLAVGPVGAPPPPPPAAFSRICLVKVAKMAITSSNAMCTRSTGPTTQTDLSFASGAASSTLTIADDLERMFAITVPPLPMMEPQDAGLTNIRTVKDMTVSPWSFSGVQTLGLVAHVLCSSASSSPTAAPTASVVPPSCMKRAVAATPMGERMRMRQPLSARTCCSVAPSLPSSAHVRSLGTLSFKLTSASSKLSRQPRTSYGPSTSAGYALSIPSIDAELTPVPAGLLAALCGTTMSPHLLTRSVALFAGAATSHLDTSERAASCAAWNAAACASALV